MDDLWYGMPPFHSGPIRRRHEGRLSDDDYGYHAHPDWMDMAQFSPVSTYAPYLSFPLGAREYNDVHRDSPADSTAVNVPTRKPIPRNATTALDGSDDQKLSSKQIKSGGSSVESALRELHHQLTSAQDSFRHYYTLWQEDKRKIPYADEDTLARLWKDLLQAKMKDDEEGKRFRTMGARVTKCIRQARDAVDIGCFLDTLSNEYQVDRRKRIVKRLSLSCDAIVELARKAACDPAACDMLLKELDEAIKMVDPQNEDLYGRGVAKTREQGKEDGQAKNGQFDQNISNNDFSS